MAKLYWRQASLEQAGSGQQVIWAMLRINMAVPILPTLPQFIIRNLSWGTGSGVCAENEYWAYGGGKQMAAFFVTVCLPDATGKVASERNRIDLYISDRSGTTRLIFIFDIYQSGLQVAGKANPAYLSSAYYKQTPQ